METAGLRSSVVAEALTGEVTLLVSVAVLTTSSPVMPLVVLAVTVSVPEPPAASVPMFQVTVPLLPTDGAEAGAGDAETYVRPAGSGSLTTTFGMDALLGLL